MRPTQHAGDIDLSTSKKKEPRHIELDLPKPETRFLSQSTSIDELSATPDTLVLHGLLPWRERLFFLSLPYSGGVHVAPMG